MKRNLNFKIFFGISDSLSISMTFLYCNQTTKTFWDFVNLQAEAQQIWKDREIKIMQAEDTSEEDQLIALYRTALSEKYKACNKDEQKTLKERQIELLHLLMHEAKISLKFCACTYNIQKYLSGILLEVFNFLCLDLRFPDWVLEIYQNIMLVVCGHISEDVENIRKTNLKYM